MAYNDMDDFENSESSPLSFDFKGFLFKVLNLWKLILLSIGIALCVAYFINVRKENIYKMDSLISVDNDQNPFFTANTSISFNWGGTSGKVSKIITAVKTRTHNEKVVDSLQFYMQYLVQGKYRMVDVYKNTPFYIELDKTKGQIINKPIGIRFINETQYELFTEFTSERAVTQHYGNKTKHTVSTPLGSYSKVFNVGEDVKLPFVNFKLHLKPLKKVKPQANYYIQFRNFDFQVYKYKNTIKIAPFSKSSSVLRLTLIGTNKAKIVDYLNATAAILSETELKRKNLYATNTIKFIDSSLAAVNINLNMFLMK